VTPNPEATRSDGDTTGSPTGSDRQWLTASRWSSHRDWPGLLALVAVLVTFWLLGGFWGVIAWAVVASAWIAFPAIVPVAIGQFALVAVTPAEAGLTAVLPGSLSLLALLVSDIVTDLRDLPDGVVLIGNAVLLGAAVVGLISLSGIQAAGVGFVIILGTASYLLHRMLLLALGHLPENSENTNK